ncbi:MAG: class I SAM-dependent methyltransferase [Nakamurella sp.]
MAYQFSEPDVAYLVSAAGVEAVATGTEMSLSSSTMIGDLTRLRTLSGDHTAAVAETVLLRRKALARWGIKHSGIKYSGIERSGIERSGIERSGIERSAIECCGSDDLIDWGAWLFTDEALQQAPPPPVAAHRARRVVAAAASAGYDAVHDVTCSIGVDLAALCTAGALRGIFAVGSDLDPVRLAMAAHNMAAHNLANHGDEARLMRADACTRTTRGSLRYADPARRDVTGRRISSADTIPPVADLDAIDPRHPPVLRLPPAIDYEALNRPGEIEIVSWRGTVREAVAWPAQFATAKRRATVLGDGNGNGAGNGAGNGDGDSDSARDPDTGDPGTYGGVLEEFTDRDPAQDSVIPARRYLVDPDPAVVRAHLVQQYAARHGLAKLDEHLAYLTGDEPPVGRRAFEILDAAAYSEKTVRGWLRRDDVGTLEIKQRGTSVIPDELRRRVKPSGERHIQRTLVIARIGRATQAFWCRAVIPDTGRHTVS